MAKYLVATLEHLAALKALADGNRRYLGFVHRTALLRSIEREEVLAIVQGEDILGFCQYYQRRDGIVTIYHLVVAESERRKGLGRALVEEVGRRAAGAGCRQIRLKCPDGLEANAFYQRIGFQHNETEGGHRQALIVWERCLAND